MNRFQTAAVLGVVWLAWFVAVAAVVIAAVGS